MGTHRCLHNGEVQTDETVEPHCLVIDEDSVVADDIDIYTELLRFNDVDYTILNDMHMDTDHLVVWDVGRVQCRLINYNENVYAYIETHVDE